nr:DUF2946 family protein [Xanthomonas codiaei]
MPHQITRGTVHATDGCKATMSRLLRPDTHSTCLSIRPMRSPVLHRWFHGCAWLAVLLVVLAPLVSRAIAYPATVSMHVLDAHAAHQLKTESAALQPAGMHHMCHGMGEGMEHAMQTMQGSAAAAESDSPLFRSDASHAEHEPGVDCEYCLMAARLISLLVALLLLLTRWLPVFRASAGLVDTRRVPALGIIGARGPPSALTF